MFRYALVIFWMAMIFWFSAHSAPESTQQSGVILNQLHSHGATWVDMHEVRKAAHFGLYMVLGALICNLLRSYGFGAKKLLGLSIVVAAAYATTDEIHQLFITGRSSEIRDVVIDTIGAGVGALLFYAVLRHAHTLKRKKEPEQ